MSDSEDIIGIVRTLLGKGVTVTMNNEMPTCFWDYERNDMTLSNQVIPKVLWGTVAEPLLLTGASIHECGHPIYDARTLDRRIAKMKTVKNPQLMKDAMNIINDSGVNFRMQLEWGATVASHLKFLLTTMGNGMAADLSADLKAGKPVDPIRVMLAIGNFNVRVADVQHVLDAIDPTFRSLVFEGVRCIRQSTTSSLWEDKSSYFDELYRIMTLLQAAQQKSSGSGASNSMPNQMGGTWQIQGDGKCKAQAEKDAKSQSGDGDEEGEEGKGEGEGDGEGDGEEQSARAKSGKKKNQKTRSVGWDPNAKVDSPKPNIAKYLNIVARNQKHIKIILDRLKQDVTVILQKDRYLRAGRIMPSMITRAATLRYPPTNMYQRMRVQEEKEPTRWSIYVDLSGSMNLEETMDALVTLAEVASHYLLDNEFAIYVFGNNFLKVKSFYEGYDNVKARIGGLSDLGGTYMFGGLEAIVKEFESFPNGHRNRIILVSDFAMMDDDDKKCLALLKEFTAKPKSKVICLDMGGYQQGTITSHFKREPIRNIAELPDRFIESYIEDRK